MRKFLALTMMLVMVASAMICGCPDARAETNSHQQSHSSHHDDSDHHHNDGSNLELDCTGTDMQLPQQANISKPDVKSSFHVDYIWTDEKPVWSLASADSSAIRGPPPWDDPPNAKPPILLTTQRLRI
ncbi:MAG TPA: hypothetical protein VIF12_07090 [Micavibrio sp.]